MGITSAESFESNSGVLPVLVIEQKFELTWLEWPESVQSCCWRFRVCSRVSVEDTELYHTCLASAQNCCFLLEKGVAEQKRT